MRWFPLTLAVTLALTLTVGAHAQQGLQPVEQTVQDVDPLAAGLRRVDPGNARFSPRSHLYQAQPAALRAPTGLPQLDQATGLAMPHRYVYRAPGVRALLDRPSYVVRDGRVREVVPAGTVFDLVPRPSEINPLATPTPPEPADDWVDHRLDTRLDTRIDTRLDGHIQPTNP